MLKAIAKQQPAKECKPGTTTSFNGLLQIVTDQEKTSSVILMTVVEERAISVVKCSHLCNSEVSNLLVSLELVSIVLC